MDIRKKLVELLSKYFNIGDSYAYNLTRVKSAFACGTVGLDDFEEFDDETVENIASYLISNGVTVQEWVSVEDRLPEDMGNVLVTAFWHETWGVQVGWYSQLNKIWHIITPQGDVGCVKVSHWMPLPEPPKGE